MLIVASWNSNTVTLSLAEKGEGPSFAEGHSVGWSKVNAPNEEPPGSRLREVFNDSLIYERDGVQFVVVPPDEDIAAGNSVHVVVFAQNCMDAPRELTLSLSRLRMATLRPSRFAFETSATLALSPCADGRVSIPVAIGRGMKGLYVWKVVPRVTGQEGKRMIPWSARRSNGGLITLTLTALGVLARGDEPRFQVRVRSAAEPELSA